MTHDQRGVALLESLVSMVVLAIGLLGMAALLTYSMKSMGKAQYAAQATYAAQMITSAIFAQDATQNANSLAGLNALNGVTTVNYATNTAGNSNVNPVLVDALEEWSTYTLANLPAGMGSLSVTTLPTGPSGSTSVPCTALPCQVTVIMSWNGADHVPQSYQTSLIMGY